MSDRHDLELVLGSGVPILVIETADETRFLALLTQIAIESPKVDYRPLFRWTSSSNRSVMRSSRRMCSGISAP